MDIFSSLMCHRFNFFIPYMPLPSLSFWRQWHRGDGKFKTMALKGCSNFQWHIGDELHFSVAYREFTRGWKEGSDLLQSRDETFLVMIVRCRTLRVSSPKQAPRFAFLKRVEEPSTFKVVVPCPNHHSENDARMHCILLSQERDWMGAATGLQ